ncbi:hypothetical protein ACHAWF_002271 [Thalassiosira exigua]
MLSISYQIAATNHFEMVLQRHFLPALIIPLVILAIVALYHFGVILGGIIGESLVVHSSENKLGHLRGQVFSIGPKFNVGPFGLSYPQWLIACKKKMNITRLNNGAEACGTDPKTAWKGWVDLGGSYRRKHKIKHPEGAILKLILMTMNDPLIQDWVFYHGEMIGFENLYILDGSSWLEQIEFLETTRNKYGLNVIFTPANLNELEDEMNVIAEEIRFSSDMIIKMDTDEYLAFKTSPDEPFSSPFVVSQYLSKYSNVEPLLTGAPARIGYIAGSKPNLAICQNGGDENFAHFHWNEHEAGHYKEVFDSRTVRAIDLGGHGDGDVFYPPFKDVPETATNFSIFHVHNRCYRSMLEADEKALVSHGYIDASDSQEEKLKDLQELIRTTSVCDAKTCDVGLISCHKVYNMAKVFAGCDEVSEMAYYEAFNGHGTMSGPFVSYFDMIHSKYRYSHWGNTSMKPVVDKP